MSPGDGGSSATKASSPAVHGPRLGTLVSTGAAGQPNKPCTWPASAACSERWEAILHRQCVQECKSPDQISRHDQPLLFRVGNADCHRQGFLSVLRRMEEHLMESVWTGGMQYTLLILTAFLD